METTHVVKRSHNAKLGPIAATYRGQTSCPSSCAFYNNGCYATGRIFSIARRFGSDEAQSILDLAETIPQGGTVRFNVAGDFLAADGQVDREYVDACNELIARRPDLHVICYTHAWRQLEPGAFSFVVNASCETLAEVREAQELGWRQTVLTDSGDEHSTIGTKLGDRQVTQCPAQTHNVTCADCRACAADTRTRPVIAFVAHGTGRAKVVHTLHDARIKHDLLGPQQKDPVPAAL